MSDRQQVQAGRDILGRDLDGFATSDELLRAGEPGLRFFEVFAPLYSQYTHTAVDYRSEFLAPYRNLRGIDLAAFRHDAAAFAGVSTDLDESRHVLLSSSRALGSHWRGDGAQRAGAHIDRVLGQADEVGRDIGALGRAVAQLGAGIAEQVRSRARVVLELYAHDCGGLPYRSVADLVDIATNQPASVSRDVVENARKFLDNHFVPEFEASLAQFREVALAAVEDSIRGLWLDFVDTTAQSVLAAHPFADLPLVLPSSADPGRSSQWTDPAVPQVGAIAGPPGGRTQRVTAALEPNVVLTDDQIAGTCGAGAGGPVSTRPAAFAGSGLFGTEPAGGVALPGSWADGVGQPVSAAGWELAAAGGSAGQQPGGATLGQGNAGLPGYGGATLGAVPASGRTGEDGTLPARTGDASLGDADDRGCSARRPLPPGRQDTQDPLGLVGLLREMFGNPSSRDRDR